MKSSEPEPAVVYDNDREVINAPALSKTMANYCHLVEGPTRQEDNIYTVLVLESDNVPVLEEALHLHVDVLPVVRGQGDIM